MKILFIGSRLYHGVADYVNENGITSIMSESNPNSPNLKLPDEVHLVPRGMEAPMELAIKKDVDAVLPLIGIDGPLLDVGKMKDQLESQYGIPVVASNESAASISTSKIKTKDFFSNNKIKTPDYQIHNNIGGQNFIDNNKYESDNLNSQINAQNQSKIQFPSVLKQSQGQGGVGIMVARNKKDFDEYFKKYDTGIVEKFVEGYEISVEVLRWQKKAVPLAVVCKGKTTLECVHPLDKVKYAPADIDGLSNQLASDLALKITNLMGSEGSTDIDMIFEPSSGKLFAIEMNTRPSGTRYLTTASSGINPLHQMVDMAMGVWDVNNVNGELKEYYALEIPVGNFKCHNHSHNSQNFQGQNSWVVHGPKNYERVTIRGQDKNKAYETAKKLKIDF
jgi:carbamoylphosphate synthase large subunit